VYIQGRRQIPFSHQRDFAVAPVLARLLAWGRSVCMATNGKIRAKNRPWTALTKSAIASVVKNPVGTSTAKDSENPLRVGVTWEGPLRPRQFPPLAFQLREKRAHPISTTTKEERMRAKSSNRSGSVIQKGGGNCRGAPSVNRGG